jgi:hypothetical protein
MKYELETKELETPGSIKHRRTIWAGTVKTFSLNDIYIRDFDKEHTYTDSIMEVNLFPTVVFYDDLKGSHHYLQVTKKAIME